MKEYLIARLQENTEHVSRSVLARTERFSDRPKHAAELASFFARHEELSIDEELDTIGVSGVGASLHSEHFNGVRHKHSFFEILFVLDGELTEEISDQTIHLKAADVCVHNPAAHHTVTEFNAKKSLAINLLVSREVISSSFYSILMKDERLDAFFNRSLTATESFMVFRETSPELENMLELLLGELFRDAPSGAVLESALLLFFAELLRTYKTEKNDLHTRIVRFIAENLQTVTLEACAAHFSYHPKYLSALIKKLEGVTFSELTKRLRVRKAATLLSYTDHPIERIAELVGYRDPSSLYTYFKNEHGISPAAYRFSEKQKNALYGK